MIDHDVCRERIMELERELADSKAESARATQEAESLKGELQRMRNHLTLLLCSESED